MFKHLKIGLVGAGVFAGYHANKLSEHARVKFVGVYDLNDDNAANMAYKHEIKAHSLEALLAESDAVVIACPASFHGDVARLALEAGCHCLIEKPLATTAAQSETIVRLAAENNLIVQIGHQERMVLRAIGLDVVEEHPLAIKAVRSNPYSSRGTDASVTMDLMTHDIDLCTALFGRAPDTVKGRTRCVKSETSDESHAALYYGDARADLFASRVVETGERHMTLTYPSGSVHIDFNAKTLVHDTPFDLNVDFAADPRAQDSLGAATDVFVCAILDGTPVLVGAKDGAIAVQVATQIDGDV